MSIIMNDMVSVSSLFQSEGVTLVHFFPISSSEVVLLVRKGLARSATGPTRAYYARAIAKLARLAKQRTVSQFLPLLVLIGCL